ncbi:type II secretion system F family protein [Chlorobium sp. N1]|uniref:type II secretion system F family protein n=1 Tax=Chlorobium sp. N1 TaxID=2491138 RepID=UPI001039D435|nr:type II secretion system F family protein [Chlorobium sp. N1]TCD47236.1 type II secretion system F family protein [Chlorobium sp. N1]
MNTTIEILAIVLSGVAAASVVPVVQGFASEMAVKKRLLRVGRNGGESAASLEARKVGLQRVSKVVNILSKLSLPEEGWQDSGLQLKFLQAGIRDRNAPGYYFAVKTVLTFVFPAMLALFLHLTRPEMPFMQATMYVLLSAAAGYYIPELILRFMTARRIGRMRDCLPDMIDLMLICTESGMGIDSAIARISRDMARSCPELAEEFYLSTMEMRAGASRIESLRNLALRAKLEELDDLVSMFVQADRFGTSLAEALRVHADMMRTKRSQRAEEIAAKIPVKLTLPLGLFIFPTLIIVLLGPAIIRVMETFSK